MLKGLKLSVVVDEKVVLVQVHHRPAICVEDFRLKRHKSHIQLDGELRILCRQTREATRRMENPILRRNSFRCFALVILDASNADFVGRRSEILEVRGITRSPLMARHSYPK